jgi:predicted phage replisome organizer
MSDNKKYYYLKLKENFYDTEEIKIIESLENGYLYTNILLKMYLCSLKHEGKLIFREGIPYNSKMLATITNHNIDIIEKAIRVFKEFGLIDIMATGEIYMLDIQQFIGKYGSEAERKRIYREKIKNQKLLPSGTLSHECPEIRPPEIELELKKKIETYTADENLRKAIVDYVEHLDMLDKPIKTVKTLNLILKELDKHDNKIEVLNQSIMHGWKGLYELKEATQQTAATKAKPKYKPLPDMDNYDPFNL